jgi:hypothetical protein
MVRGDRNRGGGNHYEGDRARRNRGGMRRSMRGNMPLLGRSECGYFGTRLHHLINERPTSGRIHFSSILKSTNKRDQLSIL